MAFTNAKHKTPVMGFNIPNLLIYAAIAVVVIFLTGLWKSIRNFFKSINGGIDSILGGDSSDKIYDDLFKQIEKRPKVQYQMNSLNKSFATTLIQAMQGAGTDEKAIFSVFDKITGPYQFQAIYVLYGRQKLNYAPTYLSFLPPVLFGNLAGSHDGDLVSALKSELSSADLKEKRAKGVSIEEWFLTLNYNK